MKINFNKHILLLLCSPEKIATTKLAKVDFQVVLAIMLTVILAPRLGVKITRSMETRNKNATNGCDNSGYEQKRTEGNNGMMVVVTTATVLIRNILFSSSGSVRLAVQQFQPCKR